MLLRSVVEILLLLLESVVLAQGMLLICVIVVLLLDLVWPETNHLWGCCFSCLQIARDFGASDIIAVDVQDDKLEKAKTLGATSWLEPRLSLKEPIAIKKFNCLSSPKTEMVFPQLPSCDQETASLVIMLQQLQRRRRKEISSLLIIWQWLTKSSNKFFRFYFLCFYFKINV